jgi:cysteinyl-tRNA synthetase, unknown class
VNGVPGRLVSGLALVVSLGLAVAGCGGRSAARPVAPGASSAGSVPVRLDQIRSWVYLLQAYQSDTVDALARAPHQLAVIDLARDGSRGFFTAAEVGTLRRSGKVVLAYFEIGSIEDFRPEYPELRESAGDLIGNEWSDWPGEYFVRYWDQRWWDRVIRPRVDRAVNAGFDGMYLDTPLAYEELDLGRAPGRTRADLARAMVDLIVRISRYAKAQRPGMLVFPQNSPELRAYDGYLGAIDGVGMEELFFLAHDEPCVQSWCGDNLADARVLRAAGKAVLAVDYATTAWNVRAACDRYAVEGFAGYVTTRGLDVISPPCG